MKRRTAKEQELADDAYLLRAWKRWHREQLKAAFGGVHGAVLERLMMHLKDLRSARELVNFIATEDWSAVDAATRLICLHEVNTAITKLREKSGMEPIDDPLPGQTDNAFRIIRDLFKSFPPNVGKHTEASPVTDGGSNVK
jgi:hypothetical protein